MAAHLLFHLAVVMEHRGFVLIEGMTPRKWSCDTRLAKERVLPGSFSIDLALYKTVDTHAMQSRNQLHWLHLSFE